MIGAGLAHFTKIVIPVLSFADDAVDRTVRLPNPDVGLRWGSSGLTEVTKEAPPSDGEPKIVVDQDRDIHDDFDGDATNLDEVPQDDGPPLKQPKKPEGLGDDFEHYNKTYFFVKEYTVKTDEKKYEGSDEEMPHDRYTHYKLYVHWDDLRYIGFVNFKSGNIGPS
jgi:hypothetical protein